MASSVKFPPRMLAIICAACTGIVLAVHLSQFAPWLQLELACQDQLIRFGRKSPVRPDLVFLGIDQASVSLDAVWDEELTVSPALQKMKATGWPWTRDVYALIIERLVSAGAKVVVFDLLFAPPRDGDDAFRAALEKYSGQVVIGSNFADAERESGAGSALSPPAPTLIPGDAANDPRVGFVNFWGDGDGVVRRTYFRRTIQDVAGQPSPADATPLLSLSARILEKGGQPERIPPGTGSRQFRFAGDKGSGLGFTPLPLYGIFVPRIWDNPPYEGGRFFKDKIVLIGPEGNWSKDYVATPFGPMRGPELHLNVLNAALNRDFPSGTTRGMGILLIVLAGAGAWALSAWIDRPVLRLFLVAAGSAAYYGFAQVLYNSGIGGPPHLVLILAPLVAADGSALVWLVWDYVAQRVEKRRTRRLLERYVSRNVVSEILDNPSTFLHTLGGVRRPVAIMFTDLRGFTALTENADSQQLVAQLNEYFSKMVQQVFANRGTVDKFLGDAIMAVWGNVQTEGPEMDVARAVTAALEMRRGLADLNKRWRENGSPELTMGFGINFGEAIVGNIGSSEKMELTVIGDSVNLASRLEGLTKEYGVDLILGETAGELAAEHFYMQFVDRVQVKGRTKPVNVYTVIRRKSEAMDPAMRTYLACYDVAMEKYRTGRFGAAAEGFRHCVEMRSNDPLSSVYLERCLMLEKEPRNEAWDGVFVMNTK